MRQLFAVLVIVIAPYLLLLLFYPLFVCLRNYLFRPAFLLLLLWNFPRLTLALALAHHIRDLLYLNMSPHR